MKVIYWPDKAKSEIGLLLFRDFHLLVGSSFHQYFIEIYIFYIFIYIYIYILFSPILLTTGYICSGNTTVIIFLSTNLETFELFTEECICFSSNQHWKMETKMIYEGIIKHKELVELIRPCRTDFCCLLFCSNIPMFTAIPQFFTADRNSNSNSIDFVWNILKDFLEQNWFYFLFESNFLIEFTWKMLYRVAIKPKKK